ncbi:MAG: alpha/beta fold hydrolase [Verrucomicrobiota bacterium]
MIPAVRVIRNVLDKNNRCIATAAIAFFVTGVLLSQRVEPGVRVKTVTLAGNTPALEFLPAGLGPHPVALLGPGFAAPKETLFRYGEALAAAGFECFVLDFPGHGASPQQQYSLTEAVRTVAEVARAVGPVDVFLGQSMGAYAGSGAARDGDLKLKLFIAVGALPQLGGHGPPLVLLAGQFDEVYPPARLRERTDARLVLSPWSDHIFETWSPVLVNAAVKAACAAVGKTPPPPPTCWRWRLAGVVLGVLGALGLALCLPKFPPRWAWARGPLVSAIFLIAFCLTARMWLDVAPHPRLFPLQITGMVVTLIVLMGASRIHLPRWIFFGLAVLIVAIHCLITGSAFLMMLVLLMALILLVGTILGVIATHRGSRLDGNIAIAIVVGCSLCLFHRPSYHLDVPPRVLIKLDTKLLDAYVGQYELAPDAVFRSGMKLTIRRQGYQLIAQAQGRGVFRDAFHIYPESETNFLATFNGAQFTFIKNDEGEVTGVIHHLEWLPDSEGKKLTN